MIKNICAQPNMCADIPEVYTITCGTNNSSCGVVTCDKTSAVAGEMVTITATPDTDTNTDNDWRVFDIKVGNNHLDLSNPDVFTNNTAVFTMPANNVNVSVTFVKNTTPVVFFKGSDFVFINDGFSSTYIEVNTDNYQGLSSLSIEYIPDDNPDDTNNTSCIRIGNISNCTINSIYIENSNQIPNDFSNRDSFVATYPEFIKVILN